MWKAKWYQKIAQYITLIVMWVITYLVLHTGYYYVLNLKKINKNSFNLLMKFLLIFLRLFMRKTLKIPNDKGEDFNDNINFK